jgi:hypothetical protein
MDPASTMVPPALCKASAPHERHQVVPEVVQMLCNTHATARWLTGFFVLVNVNRAAVAAYVQ